MNTTSTAPNADPAVSSQESGDRRQGAGVRSQPVSAGDLAGRNLARAKDMLRKSIELAEILMDADEMEISSAQQYCLLRALSTLNLLALRSLPKS